MHRLALPSALAHLRTPSSTQLAPWANGLLVLILAYSAAQLTWAVLPVRRGPAPAVPRLAEKAPVPAADGPARLGGVAGLHLFGVMPDKAAQAKPEVPTEAPDTHLNLTLRGLIASGDQQAARAIIADAGGRESHYRVNDRLPGGAVLTAIHKDRVLLERNGRYETLRLPKESLPGQAVAPTGREAGGRGRVSSVVTRQLRQYRDRIVENPQEVANLARIEPVMEDGGLKGYKLEPGKDPRLFRLVGLRPGDVVTRVNGMPLNNPAALGELASQFSSATAFEVTVERDGQERTVMVSLGE